MQEDTSSVDGKDNLLQCVCGRNKQKPSFLALDKGDFKLGFTILFALLVIGLFLNWHVALIALGVLSLIALLIALIRVIMGHSIVCALRWAGVLLVAFFGNIS